MTSSNSAMSSRRRRRIDGSPSLERTVFVVNPVSGGGRGLRRWQHLRQALPEIREARVIQGDSAAESADRLRAEVEQGEVRRVISVGGDGTAHLVANTLLSVAEPSPVALGVLPAGTGSDLARHLALPRDPTRALKRVLAASARPLDVIALRAADGRRRYSINIASGGLSGAVVRALSGNPKRGQLSYLLATVVALWKYQASSCRVEVDGAEIFDDALFLVAVANGEFFGKGMRVAPGADTGDGRLEVIIVPPVARWQFPWRLPQFLVGRHLGWPGVQHRQVQRVRLEPRSGFPPFELDGEYFEASDLELEIRPGALQILV